MKKNVAIKSSFTLPPQEVALVTRLKRRLRLASNTAVVRQALHDLQKKLDRDELKRQFVEASHLVREVNREDMRELDQLANEGLGAD